MKEKIKQIQKGIPNREIRMLDNFEVRAIDDSSDESKRTIGGTLVEYNKLSLPLGFYGEFRERIAKGAFDESIREDVIKSLWNHGTSDVLGSSKSSTLRLINHDDHIEYEVDLPNSPLGSNVFESVKRGDVDGNSWRMKVSEDAWEWNEDEDIAIRTILKAKLVEISPTTFPAYEDASSVDVRSKDYISEKIDELRKHYLFDESEARKRSEEIRGLELELLEEVI